MERLSEMGKENSSSMCMQILRCGHHCNGILNESSCPPCLYGCQSLKPRTECPVCMEPLSERPIILLRCGHTFHHQCILTILKKRWHGDRINFGFMSCPLCKISISHPSLDNIITPLAQLYEDVRRMALTRLQHDGLFSSHGKDPTEVALNRYAYYMCSKCNKPYFGGERRCDEVDVEINKKELICTACSHVSKNKICGKHGSDYLQYKCRYCCSLALFYCFGTTHFCDTCHNNHTVVTSSPKDKLPKCPAGPCGKQLVGEVCPLRIEHPPTGEEFVIGCALCENYKTF